LKLGDAEAIVVELKHKDNLGQHIAWGQICGSIRRKKEFVNDIDWVIVPFPESKYYFSQESLDTTIKRLGGDDPEIMLGSKIKRFMYKGISVDIYIADMETYQTLMLIRTGSKEHNIMLTTLAREKGLKLFASGKGLCKVKGGIYNNEPEEIIEVVENTELGILTNLVGNYVPPEVRA